MTRTLTWIFFAAGVLTGGRLLPGPAMPWNSIAWVLVGSATALVLHWSLNRSWKYRMPLYGCDCEECR